LPVVLIGFMGGDQDGEDGAAATVEVARPDKRNSEVRRGADAGELDLAQLRRAPSAAEPGNAFESKSWYVPPPPPPPPPPAPPSPPPPPPKPTAPPLPFTYLGKYQDAAAQVFFLVRGDRVLTVKVGDTIEGTYKVDGIVGTSLGLTYLPLNIKQKIDIGSAG